MVLRLWWKEARVFWPLWAVLGAAAAVVQWYLLWNRVHDARIGLLIVLGPSWALLYAFAVGAAIFAAESEGKTQVFLDTLPVDRRMLWTNKTLFALATTLILALVLTALGVLGTAEYDASAYPISRLVLGQGVTLVEAIAWSFLWSLVFGSALQAAVLGLLTVGAINVAVAPSTYWWNPAARAPLVGPRLALAAAALAVSWVLYTRGPRPDRPRVAVRALPARPSLRLQYGRLAWETVRESGRTWLILAAGWIGLILAAAFSPSGGADLGGFWVVLGVLSALVAGVSVFGSANRSQSYRFFAHHGVHPASVWTTKVLLWTVMLAVAGLAAVLLGLTRQVAPPRDASVFEASVAIVGAFVVALLLGQVVRRSITAWVLALLAFLSLVLPQFVLYSASIIPQEGLVLFPGLVLAISRAWTGDWMNDLRGRVRWLRLEAMVGAAAVVLAACFIGYRAWSVPAIASPFPPDSAARRTVPVNPEDDAGPEYLRIITELRFLNAGKSTREDGGDERPPEWEEVAQLAASEQGAYRDPAVIRWWQPRRGLIDSFRRAAARPEARFRRTDDSVAVRRGTPILGLPLLVRLVGVDSAERRWAGELARAWDDLRAVFLLANQLQRAGGFPETRHALEFRTQALQWSLAWAADRHQTPAQLRAVLADYRALPAPSPLAESLEVEYDRIARTIRDDPDALADYIVGGARDLVLLRKLSTAWWERERTLRVLRHVFDWELRSLETEPWQQRFSRQHEIRAVRLEWYVKSTPQVQLFEREAVFVYAHENILLARAFEQVVALRIWQLEHEGHYPETLEALVPEPLPSLPPDPYSGRHFLYRRASGELLLPLGLSGLTRAITGQTPQSRPTQPGQWVLYSVGPNGHDDGAEEDYETSPARGDLIFPLPP
jgi:hypothetical protein